MISIKSFCIGNKEKSYYIDDFENGVNIIHSDDNNKGKTIVSQGIMFALGNTPTFPSGFEMYKDYYYLVTLEINGKNILICRKNDCFIVDDGNISVYDSVNEFKKYFSKNISNIPSVNYYDNSQIFGLELFIEMIFLPQDNRSTSNIINKGRYTKENYFEFLYSYMKCSKALNPYSISQYKNEINSLEEKRKILKNSIKLLKSKSVSAAFSTYTASKSRIDEKIKSVEKCKESISELITKKNKYLNKIIKNELLLKEITSLNRELDEGKLVCSDCGSTRISYESSKSGVMFEVSDIDTRNQIKEIINARIATAKEDIQHIEALLIEKRSELSDLMRDEDVSMENLLFYKEDIKEASSIDQEIYSIDLKILDLKNKIKAADNLAIKEIESKEKVLSNFLSYMNEFYKYVEPDDSLVIDDIFTKNSINYSGSQGALFLMSRIYAASKIMNLDFPVYIDDFRDGELSSEKEIRVIEKLKELNKQIILTCTLKNEENDKYEFIKGVNEISFDEITKFNLLHTKYNNQFRLLLKKLNIDLN